MAIAPITGMLRRNLWTDLTISIGLGVTAASLFWHGYHMPRTHARDNFYKKLEDEREAARAV
ncbi:cytochrome-c oxidase, subunit VIIa [Xylariaceae sp. FL0662B]|nr:cytochrome-c oxidase, subunit VIIa [Xylariaceae sp. FL0662B]